MKKLFLILAIALGGTWLPPFVFAYDQQNTHPALTDEAVDFYNLNFPQNKISDKERSLLIKGAIDEDIGVRPMNHFYDPVYNQGWLGYISSKIWAKSSSAQQLDKSLLAINPISLQGEISDNWPSDFSYERALLDYAKGDKDRAFEAFGHVMHLLEDSNVPEHTRNDTHLPFHGTGSPYETIMAKWNKENFSIAKELYSGGKRAILLNNLEEYFDSISGYSNGYFFSEDTVNSQRYQSPKIIRIEKLKFKDKNWSFALGYDIDGKEFKLALLDIRNIRNLIEIKEATLMHKDIGTLILDGYWDRLSKDFVPHGAGAIKLFLDQAEEVKKEYEERLALENQKSRNIFQRLLAAILPGYGSQENGITLVRNILSEIENENQAVTEERSFNQNSDTAGSTPISEPETVAGQTLSFLPSPLPTPKDDIATVIPVPLVPEREATGQAPSLTVTPIPTVTLTPSVTPTTGQAPTSTVTLTVTNNNRVVINEIAWAGTLASAFDEWIELYNPGLKDVNISDWTIKTNDSSINLTLSGVIKGGEYFLLERTNDDVISNIKADQTYTGALKNEGEKLILSNKNGEIIDMAGMAGQMWFAGNSTEKRTMERKNHEKSGDDSSNWGTFSGSSRPAIDAKNNPVNGTPKQTNSVTVVFAGGAGGSGQSNPSPVSTSSPQATPTPTPLPSASPTPTPTPTPTPSPTPTPEPVYLKVVINEIAWMGTATSSNDEWIEIYNLTSKSADVSGWTLKSKDGTPAINLASKSIDPFGFYLLERTADMTISDISADQIYTGALANTGEYLELRDKNNELQDSVNNSSGWFSGDNPTKSSMERVNPKESGDDSTNWSTNNGIIKNGLDAGGNPINGTPKKRNSLYISQKPSAISNLEVDSASSFGDIILKWSAPEDLDTPTSELSYKIRYATKSFDTLADWDNAESVASVSIPSVMEAGTVASSSFHIFNYNQNYYFAVKTSDGENLSDISNTPEYAVKSALFESSWPMYGRNNEHNQRSDSIGPDSEPDIDWEFLNPSGVFGQPVIGANGAVYAPSLEGPFGHLYSIDENGSQSYKFSGPVAQPSMPSAASDGTVYFGTFSPGGTVYGLNSVGSQMWSYPIGTRVDRITQGKNGDIYFTSENDRITALKPDGALKWQIENDFVFNSAPVLLDNGNLYISGRLGGGYPTVWAYGQKDGSLIWTKVFSDTCSCGASDLVYDDGADKFYLSAGGYLIILASDGSSYEKVNLDLGATNPTLVSFSDDSILAGFDLSSLNLASGSAVFSVDKLTKSINWSYETGSLINVQMPVDSDGNLYFSTQDGNLMSLDGSGSLRWDYNLPLFGSINQMSPMIDEGGNMIWGDYDKVIRLK